MCNCVLYLSAFWEFWTHVDLSYICGTISERLLQKLLALWALFCVERSISKFCRNLSQFVIESFTKSRLYFLGLLDHAALHSSKSTISFPGSNLVFPENDVCKLFQTLQRLESIKDHQIKNSILKIICRAFLGNRPIVGTFRGFHKNQRISIRFSLKFWTFLSHCGWK